MKTIEVDMDEEYPVYHKVTGNYSGDLEVSEELWNEYEKAYNEFIRLRDKLRENAIITDKTLCNSSYVQMGPKHRDGPPASENEGYFNVINNLNGVEHGRWFSFEAANEWAKENIKEDKNGTISWTIAQYDDYDNPVYDHKTLITKLNEIKK